jgi:hypothetical protein
MLVFTFKNLILYLRKKISMKTLLTIMCIMVSIISSKAQRTANTGNNNTSKVGKRVEVLGSGFWYKATVLEQKGDLYLVHYDRSGDADEWRNKSYIRDLDKNDQPITVSCSFSPPAGQFKNSSPASDDLFKKELYDYYNRSVTGTISSPTRIGIIFTSFQREAPYQNTVEILPGRGAKRKHDGAPVNATIYPVKTTFFLCEEYGSGITQKQVNSNFSFFKDKYGEWTCYEDFLSVR